MLPSLLSTFLLVVIVGPFSRGEAVTTYQAINPGDTSDVFTGVEANYFGPPTGSSISLSWGDAVVFNGYVGIDSNISTAGYVGAPEISLDTLLPMRGLIFVDSGKTVNLNGHLLAGAGFGLEVEPRLGSSSSGERHIILSNDLVLNASAANPLKLAADSGQTNTYVFNGAGKRLTLLADRFFDLDTTTGKTALVLKNMDLMLSNPYIALMRSANQFLVLDNVNIYLLPDQTSYSFTQGLQGNVIIKGRVTVNGPGKTLQANMNGAACPAGTSLYIEDNAALVVNDGVNLYVGTDVADRSKKIWLKGSYSSLHLNNCTLTIPVAGITYPGLQLERGNLILENRVVIDNEGNTDAHKGLMLGNGSSAGRDLRTQVLGDALMVVDGFLYHNPSAS